VCWLGRGLAGAGVTVGVAGEKIERSDLNHDCGPEIAISAQAFSKPILSVIMWAAVMAVALLVISATIFSSSFVPNLIGDRTFGSGFLLISRLYTVLPRVVGGLSRSCVCGSIPNTRVKLRSVSAGLY